MFATEFPVSGIGLSHLRTGSKSVTGRSYQLLTVNGCGIATSLCCLPLVGAVARWLAGRLAWKGFRDVADAEDAVFRR